MISLWKFFLLLLTLSLALAASQDPSSNEMKVLRTLTPVNVTNANVRQSLWFAMQEYNKHSEDKHVFLVTKILQAQLQITDRLEYLIDAEIARSTCRKPVSEDEGCMIEKNAKLGKKLYCNFWVRTLPWNGEFTVIEEHCKDV
ncbi:cystatin-8 [Lepus europaeus]|uniref:cystatin-8 n=1 Tax=Lepus europaeus TaxID=9983 RepID=UPI002B469B35|nr:cystatin-8 [Lepus europaeus]